MSDTPPIQYAIRLSPRAQRDIAEAVAYFQRTPEADVATAWREGLFRALGTLATYPERLPLARDHRRFTQTTRQLIYRRTPNSLAYRVLFHITELPDEASFVYVVHIRHGARGPIKKTEAWEMEAEQ